MKNGRGFRRFRRLGRGDTNPTILRRHATCNNTGGRTLGQAAYDLLDVPELRKLALRFSPNGLRICH